MIKGAINQNTIHVTMLSLSILKFIFRAKAIDFSRAQIFSKIGRGKISLLFISK
jgi:hypothetical protein